MRARLLLLAFVVSAAACVIGPKQDDPIAADMDDSGTPGGDEGGDAAGIRDAGGSPDAMGDTTSADSTPSDAPAADSGDAASEAEAEADADAADGD